RAPRGACRVSPPVRQRASGMAEERDTSEQASRDGVSRARARFAWRGMRRAGRPPSSSTAGSSKGTNMDTSSNNSKPDVPDQGKLYFGSEDDVQRVRSAAVEQVSGGPGRPRRSPHRKF